MIIFLIYTFSNLNIFAYKKIKKIEWEKTKQNTAIN